MKHVRTDFQLASSAPLFARDVQPAIDRASTGEPDAKWPVVYRILFILAASTMLWALIILSVSAALS